MKKLNYLLLGAAGLLMASCANDAPNAPGADGAYRLTVNLPADMATRAENPSIGQNITAPQLLNYALFDSNNALVEAKAIPFDSNATSMNLELPLLKGQSYKLALFSQSIASLGSDYNNETYAPGSKPVYSFSNGIVTVNYENMDGKANNVDAYDCFSFLYETGTVGSSISETVTLTRPVAQINWGTSDLASSTVTQVFGTGAANLRTSVSLSAFQTLNIVSGELSNTKAISIGEFAIPDNSSYTYPAGTNMQYLAMQYVLAQPKAYGTYDLTLAVTNSADASMKAIEIPVNNAPLQANYRTNIYGALLTDMASLTVDLDPSWGTPDYEVEQPNIFTIDADDLANLSINEDGIYNLKGEITGRHLINVADGLNITINGEGITNDPNVSESPFHLLFISNMPDNATTIINSTARTGNYTFKNFPVGALSVKNSNTTINITDNDLNFLSMGAANCAINITGNTIDGLQGDYIRWDNEKSDCGVYMHIIKYDLTFDNNSIYNTKGNPFQENGWTGNGGSEWYSEALQNVNKVSSFSNNKIGLWEFAPEQSGWKCAITFQGDGTYYWISGTGDEAQFSEGATALMQMIAESNNLFYIGGKAIGGNKYKFFTLDAVKDYRFDPFTDKLPEE